MIAAIQGNVGLLDLRGSAVGWADLLAALEALRADAGVHVAVIAADSGTRVDGVVAGTGETLHMFELPLVAAIDGDVPGGAKDAALGCDVIVSSDERIASRVPASGETVIDAALRIAGVIASRGPIATKLAKEAAWRGLVLPFEQALRFETDLTLLLQTTKDRAEGVQAFLEKRTPNFKGE